MQFVAIMQWPDTDQKSMKYEVCGLSWAERDNQKVNIVGCQVSLMSLISLNNISMMQYNTVGTWYLLSNRPEQLIQCDKVESIYCVSSL